MKTKTQSKPIESKFKISFVALAVVIALSIGAGLYVSGFESSSVSADNSEPELQNFDVLASISGATLSTSSGSVSAVGVDVTSTSLQTSNQVGDETVEYDLTIAQTSSTVTSGGGSVPNGYGDESVTNSGSQSASSSGSESYGGQTMNDQLTLNLSDAGAGTLANDVSVNSGQTIDFSFSTDGSATLKDANGGVLDTSSTNGGATATVSDAQANIDTFSINGNLQLQE